MLPEPLVTSAPGIVQFEWRVAQVVARVSRLREHSNGDITAEVLIKTWGGGDMVELVHTKLNLLADRSKDQLANKLENAYPLPIEGAWSEIIQTLCRASIGHHRTGEPVIELNTIDPAQRLEYLVWPFLPKGLPTVICGPGGTFKSFFAQLLSVAAMLPWAENKLGLRMSEESTNVLYLDYETDYHSHHWRLHAIKEGMALPDLFLRYRRCNLPLVDDISAIQQLVLDYRIGFIVVDSAAGAVGGDLYDPDTVIRLFGCLRKLNTTSLILAHITKADKKENAHGSPFGSVFWENYGRSVWEVKRAGEPGADEMTIGLYHRKVNDGKLYKPFGFHVDFGADADTPYVNIRRRELADVDGLDEYESIPDRVLASLRHGDRTMGQLHEVIGGKLESIQKAVARLRERGLLVDAGSERVQEGSKLVIVPKYGLGGKV